MANVSPLPAQILTRVRDLRRTMTDSEQLLWMLLRGRRLEGHKFRRQHPCGPYVLDFYCARSRVAVELDGDHHGTDEQIEYDARRRSYLVSRNIHELRFTNAEVMRQTEAVLEVILDAVSGRGEPSP